MRDRTVSPPDGVREHSTAASDTSGEETEAPPPRAGYDDSTSQLPLWFERGLVVIIAAVASIGGFGLLLALLGKYSSWLAFSIGGVGAVIVSVAAWPRRAPGADRARAPRTVRFSALGMCAVALGFTLWNGIDAGHYVSVDRDPGVYAAAGKWIATHGSLQVPAGKQWLTKGPEFGLTSAGISLADANSSKSPNGDGKVQFQFNHLAPVLFAEAEDVGGDRLMFALPAVLGAVGLCMVYAVGCRLIRRPVLVLAAVAALGVSLPQISVARDTYSETSAQLLLWGGLWLLLVAFERRRAGVAFLAGVSIAGTMLSRIDALVYLIPLPFLGAVVLLAARSRETRAGLLRLYGAFLVGAVPVAVLATIDVANRSRSYYSALHSQVRDLRLGVVASFVAALVLLAVWPRLGALRTWAGRNRSALATTASAIIIFGLLLAWSIRPAVQHSYGVYNGTVASAQRTEGLALDPTRTYDEQTMVWVSWYIGPIALALAVIGIAMLASRFVKSAEPAAGLTLSVAGVGTALYLWTDQITPTQVWAMRRYVPAALPFFVLASAYALAMGVRALPRIGISREWGRLAVVAAVVAMIGFPLGVTLPVRSYQSQKNFLPAVNRACDTIGPDAAVLLVPGDRFRLTMPQVVRSYCDVPAAALAQQLSPERTKSLAAAWRAQGRRLWIMGSSPQVITNAVPGAQPFLAAGAYNTHRLNETLSRLPNTYRVETLQVYVANVSS
jgi:hypothetical protein